MFKQYIKSITKRLHCSHAKKKELQTQLMSDLMSSMEQGASKQAAIEMMGSPTEIAADFNNNFSTQELSKYKKEKLILRLAIVGCVLLLIAVFIGLVYWFLPKGKPIEQSKSFQKNEVQLQAEHVIHLLNAEKYDELQDLSTEVMKPYLTSEKMTPALHAVSTNWGTFKSFNNSYMNEITQQGKQFAIIEIRASYENVSAVFTITFDDEMKLAGLYVK